MQRRDSHNTALGHNTALEEKTRCEPSVGHWAPQHLLPTFQGYLTRSSPEVHERDVPSKRKGVLLLLLGFL